MFVWESTYDDRIVLDRSADEDDLESHISEQQENFLRIVVEELQQQTTTPPPPPPQPQPEQAQLEELPMQAQLEQLEQLEQRERQPQQTQPEEPEQPTQQTQPERPAVQPQHPVLDGDQSQKKTGQQLPIGNDNSMVSGLESVCQMFNFDAACSPLCTTNNNTPTSQGFGVSDFMKDHGEKLGATAPSSSTNADGIPTTTSNKGCQDQQETCFQKYKWLLFGYTLIAIGVCVLLGVLLPQSNSKDRTATSNSAGDSNNDDGFEPSELPDIEYLYNLFLPISGKEALMNYQNNDHTGTNTTMNITMPLTPQYQALLWMAEQDELNWNNYNFQSNNNIQQVDPTLVIERYVMAVLYFATGGPQWDDQLRFLSNYSTCEWPNINNIGPKNNENMTTKTTSNEVVCNENSYIIKIRIEHNNMVGTIPSELKALSSIEIISLGANFLTGTIPSELGELATLNFLQFTYNALSGTIPKELGNLVHMKTLGMYENALYGTIPTELFESLSDLELLDLGSNLLQGTIPDLSTKSLKVVFLEDNQLSGRIPLSFYGQPNLETLSIGPNQLTGILGPEIGRLEGLTTLWANGNKFTGTIPSEIGLLKHCVQLKVNQNRLEGSLPLELGMLREAQVVDLSHNILSGSLPKELGDMVGLVSLNLESNSFSGEVPFSFYRLELLDHLSIQDNNITGGLEAGFCEQSSLSTVIEADCGGSSPKLSCPCCTSCCTNHGTECSLNVPAICKTQSGKFERALDRGASCTCSKDGTELICSDTSCESCDLDGDLCAVNTNYGYKFNSTTGTITDFTNTIEYTKGIVGTNITYSSSIGNTCTISLNGEKCRDCGGITCQNGFKGVVVYCDNLEGGPNFNSCEEFANPGPLALLYAFDESQLSGCPLLLEKLS